MTSNKSAAKVLHGARVILASAAMMQIVFGPFVQSARADDIHTTTPIKHVIIIVGENRTFDHIFATYIPKAGESVNNLLSEGIINGNGTKGPNYALAHQNSADITGSTVYQLSPTTGKALYPVLPAPLNGGPTNVCTDNGMCNMGDAMSSEDGLSKSPINYYQFLLTGGTGLIGLGSRHPHQRRASVRRPTPAFYRALSSSPTPRSFPYDSYANSPVHRFYQMWQQDGL